VFDVIDRLMNPPVPTKQGKIGFAREREG